MSVRTYYMDDCNLAVPPGFRDRSVNLLEWPLEGGDHVTLVVQRDRLPRAGVDAFDRFVAEQTRGYPAQFAGFHLERDEAAGSDTGLEMRRKVFRWRREQDVLYHNQVFILVGDGILLLTASAKARHRDAVDRVVDDALATLRVRGEDEG